jgi:hypothetical protein
MEHLAPRLAEIPGVVAVALGGSRADGRAHVDADWDFGLYYRGTIDPSDVRALGFDGDVFAPGEWGCVPNGGAWLVIDGARVDLIYRDLDQVEAWWRDADEGKFQVFREVGYVAGVPSYTVVAELAIARVLYGELPRPEFPEALRESAPPWWRRVSDGAVKFAVSHGRRGDPLACAGQLAVAALSEAHARLTEQGTWYLPEKDLLARVGLDNVAPVLWTIGDDSDAAVERVRELLSASSAPSRGPRRPR